MIFWGILGGVCLIYFIIICIYAGITSAFGWFWALGGGAGLLLCWVWKKLPQGLLKAIWCVLFAGLAVLVVLEGKILYYARQTPYKEADYLIVLGCQIRGTAITPSLKYRLEEAWKYAEENQDTKLVVSGGQGPGEDISEAEAMKRWIVEKGIAQERIYVEDKSTNTYENMKLSRELIEKQNPKENYRVVVVSNGFHICRGLSIGKKQGFKNLEGLGAKTDPVLAVSYYIREAAALLKDGILGNL